MFILFLLIVQESCSSDFTACSSEHTASPKSLASPRAQEWAGYHHLISTSFLAPAGLSLLMQDEPSSALGGPKLICGPKAACEIPTLPMSCSQS